MTLGSTVLELHKQQLAHRPAYRPSESCHGRDGGNGKTLTVPSRHGWVLERRRGD